MLRQVHIFFDKERIFTHSYALGLGLNELDNVIDVIRSYMDLPMPGKTFQKPLSNYQIFHQGKGDLYFVIIADQIDSLQYIGKIFNDIFKKFEEIYPNPADILKDKAKNALFIEFLNKLQKDFRSKIVLVGPLHSGKTTLYNMLKEDGTERNIMDFAKSSTFIIDNLTFDLWDFQLKDNFSLLWSKFISGADLIILIFDSSNYNLQVIDHFISLKRKEGKFSKFLILANKEDLMDNSKLKKISNELKIPEYHLVSLIRERSKIRILKFIRKTLNLKENLPENFEASISNAKEFESMGRLVEAVKQYKELIKISKDNQLFSYLETFKKKLSRLNRKIQEQVELKRKLERKKKFSAPQKLKFTKQVKVKNLPKSSKVKNRSSKNKLEVSPEDIKLKIKLIERAKSPNGNMQRASKDEKKEVEKSDDLSLILFNMIKKRGSTLDLDLCKQYLSEMEKSLSRKLEETDIEVAADLFIKQEQSFKTFI